MPDSTAHPDPNQDIFSKNFFGFWVYIMTDCVLFSCLFAAYAVLHHNTFGAAGPKELFSLPFSLGETMSLLISSFCSGLGMLAANRDSKRGVIGYFLLAYLFGVIFLGMELTEFAGFYRRGATWQTSAFLSAYYTLVSTHGIHVTIGLIWMTFLLIQISRRGLVSETFRRLSCLSLFWHFLDVIWIFIFTFVYLMGVS